MAPADTPLLRDLEASVGPEFGSELLAEVRRGAIADLRSKGLPTKKTEAWRFTPVRSVVGTPFLTVEDPPADLEAVVAAQDDRLGEDGTDHVHLVNGRLVRPSELGASVQLRSLSEVLTEDPAMLRGVLGSIAPQEHFAALNSTRFRDGVVLQLRRGARGRPLHLVHTLVGAEGPAAVYPRLIVHLEDEAEGTLIESYLPAPGRLAVAPNGALLVNLVTEIVVGPGARLNHVRFSETGGDAPSIHQLAVVAVRVETRGSYRAQTVTLGGRLTRVDLRVGLEGEGAHCELDGVYHVNGSDHVDHQTWVDHAAPRGTSRQTYRGIADGRGHSVFNGIVVVRPDAQQTNAHQENRNLLLSEDAVVHTKPHLEIDADDVACSHGATVGALDEQALFYLRSRGISKDRARDMLVVSFADEILRQVAHPPTAHRLRERVVTRLAGDTDLIGPEMHVDAERGLGVGAPEMGS